MTTKPVETVLKQKKISEIANPRLVQAPPDLSIKAAIQLMQEHRSGYIVVAKNKKVVGMFTETDVTNKILEKKVNWSSPIQGFMTKEPFSLTPQDSVSKAIHLMGKHHFYHIPLLDQKKQLVGVLSVRTLIRFLSEFYPTEVYNLPPDPAQVMDTQEGG